MTPFTVWLTGLSGSGKSTLAQLLGAELEHRQVRSLIIDGDALRQGASKGLGFTREDRDTNVRNAVRSAQQALGQGSCAIVALMSPYRAARDTSRRSLGRFCEVYCECPLSVLLTRDAKGLYLRAQRGELRDFIGLDGGYEAPATPEVHLRTDLETPEQSLERIVRRLEELSYLPGRGH
jgi:adenylyl-sulfate kinase